MTTLDVGTCEIVRADSRDYLQELPEDCGRSGPLASKLLVASTHPTHFMDRSRSHCQLREDSDTRPLTERIRTGHVLVAMFAAATLFSTWHLFMFFFSG